MPKKWTRATGTYDESSTSDSDINNFRANKLRQWDGDDFGGTLVLGEGEVWIDLIGDETDIDDEMHSLENDSFFDSFTVRTQIDNVSGMMSGLYAYYEDEDPLTPDDLTV